MFDSRDLDELLQQRSRLESRAAATPERTRRLRELRAWQSARLARTYDDLLHDPPCADAARFFLTDLYGPADHATRDLQLTRAWPLLKNTLPPAVLELLGRALALDVLSAELDQAMVEQIGAGPLTAASYAAAYRAIGKRDAREQQVALVVRIGEDLGQMVRHAWIALALRAARLPARVAGFGALQDFIERGFAAFHKTDARRMLTAIRERESQLSAALFSGDDAALDVVHGRSTHQE